MAITGHTWFQRDGTQEMVSQKSQCSGACASGGLRWRDNALCAYSGLGARRRHQAACGQYTSKLSMNLNRFE